LGKQQDSGMPKLDGGKNKNKKRKEKQKKQKK
jgi:hypothetical protein